MHTGEKVFALVSIVCVCLAVGLKSSVITIPEDYVLWQRNWDWIDANVSLVWIILSCIAPFIIYQLAILLFVPLEHDVAITESEHAPKSLKKRLTNSGVVPPPYPNGWFYIEQSANLKIAQTKHVSVLGSEYVLFRGEDGKARIVSAFCPHLGASLAIGGTVKQDCITCPFHGWQFNGDTGECVHIPYSENIPSTASIETNPVEEANGVIYMWYHANGEKPTWKVPEAEGITSWKYRCDGYSRHEISAHIQEIPENGADNAHLNILHSWPVVKFLGYLGFTHGWYADWTPLTNEQKHVAQIDFRQFFQFLGHTIPFTTLSVHIRQIGPGIVILQFNTAFGRGYIVQSVTPLEPMLQSAVHIVYMPWYIPRIIGKGLLYSLIIQVERDVPIWNNKTFVPQPNLCKGDGKIGAFRRWYSQFYTEEAKKEAKTKKSALEW